MPFPLYRPRRLRESPLLRKMVRETQLRVDDFVYPLFTLHGRGVREPIASMPGQFRLSVDELLRECKDAASMGIPAVLLFGLPADKDPRGSEAYAEDGIIQQAVRAVKETIPDLLVLTDVCLCEYTSHGHCGVVEEGRVRNDPTLDLLARTAVSHVEAGADMVAPSDMMDGRVAAIREALDENGNQETPIMAYSAKYASAFYGPFREAADSTPQFGDRRSYQMDPANSVEAMREVALDVDEGADIVMVKPALPYLDIIAKVKSEFGLPVAAYSVSGEYAMLRAAGQLGWLDEEAAMMEALTGIRRAGADPGPGAAGTASARASTPSRRCSTWPSPTTGERCNPSRTSRGDGAYRSGTSSRCCSGSSGRDSSTRDADRRAVTVSPKHPTRSRLALCSGPSRGVREWEPPGAEPMALLLMPRGI